MCASDGSLLFGGVLLGFALTCFFAVLWAQIAGARRGLAEDDAGDGKNRG